MAKNKILFKPEEGQKIPKVSFTPEELKTIETSLLGKFTDKDLSKKWGIHRVRILRLRNILGIPPCKYDYRRTEKLEQIISFLKDHENEIICIQDIIKLGTFMINNTLLTKTAIKKIAEENNIKVTFRNDQEYEHSYNSYINGCKCAICKLAIRLHCKYAGVITSRFCNFIANEYIDIYKQDKTKFRRQFYSFVEEQLEKHLPVEESNEKDEENETNEEDEDNK